MRVLRFFPVLPSPLRWRNCFVALEESALEALMAPLEGAIVAR